MMKAGINKKKLRRIMMAILVIPLVLILSAFKFAEKPSVTRYELAMLIEKIVLAALPDADISAENMGFSDLDGDSLQKIRATTGFRIMYGFPDGCFKPHKSVRNHEILWYLKKTSDFLRANAADKDMTRKLSRMVGLGRHDFHKNLFSSFSIFSEGQKLSDRVVPAVIEKVERKLGLIETSIDLFKIEVTDAITRKPLTPAFIALGDMVSVTDENGNASIEIERNKGKNKHEILVSAEGYRTLRLKRDAMQKKELKVQLKPLKTHVYVKAFSSVTKKPIENFRVIIDNSLSRKAIDGIAVFNKVRAGYHHLRLEAEGHRSLKKHLHASGNKLELELLLEPS